MSEQNGANRTAVALSQGQQNEIEQIRREGAYQVARRNTMNEVYKQLEGCEWGSGNQLVRGSEMSRGARAALAHFCVTTGAHPQLHVVLLGGKPWLNADYWSDRLNAEDYFVDFDQINISDDPEKRAHYGVPSWATHVYETVIRKFMALTPIEKIRSGEITDWEKYVVVVREANWAGGRGRVTRKRRDGSTFEVDGDPIGDAEPAKTARTRSLRRCAVRSFPAWISKFEAAVRQAEETLEAEWEVVQTDRANARAALPAPGERQGVEVGTGEPQAANERGAESLPVEDATQVAATDQAAGQSTESSPQQEAEEFDRTAAQRRFFGLLKANGISGDSRKAWAVAQGLPESTSTWTPEQFEQAHDTLQKQLRQRLLDAAGAIGMDYDDVDADAMKRFGFGLLEIQYKQVVEMIASYDAQAAA